MKRLAACILLAAALLATSVVAVAADKVIRLTSLDWPPYSGDAVERQGASVAVVRAAAEAMGYTLEVRFLPWSRAVATAQDPASGFHGYFPEYHSDEVARDFILSDPIGSGPLGFVEQRAAPVAWTTLDDLAGKTIGTVRDYVNTAEFDARAADGRLRVDPVDDDATNVRKVAAGRIPLAVIDRHVLNHLLHSEPALAPMRERVQFNARLLEDKDLFVAFQRSPSGEEAARVINAGLKKIDVGAITGRFFD